MLFGFLFSNCCMFSGGVGLCNTEYGRIMTEMGQNDLGLLIVIGAHQVSAFYVFQCALCFFNRD